MCEETKILIIDDNEPLANTLQELLVEIGYTTYVAFSGKEAMQIVHEHTFDLALVDIQLPDTEGHVLIKDMIEVTPETEYIIITGHASLESAIDIVGLNQILSYETKPMDLYRLQVLIRQVISRKEAEKNNKESQLKYQAIFNESVFPILILNESLRILEINTAGENLLKYSKKDLIDTDFSGLIRGSRMKNELINGLITKSSMQDFELNLCAADQKVITVLSNTKKLENEFLENKKCFVCTMVDITKRVEAKVELSIWKGRYDALMKSSGNLIYDWDTESNEIIFSENFEEVLGFKNNVHTKYIHDWFALIHRNDKELYNSANDELVNTGKVNQLEYRVMKKNGTYIYVEDNRFLVDKTVKQKLRVIGYIKDITKIKTATEEKQKREKQRRHAQKMEAIGTMAGGIAHDFNNILHAIIGFSQASFKFAQPETKLHHNLNTLCQVAFRGAGLVKQILTFSRQDDEVLCPMDISGIIKEVLRLVRASTPTSIDIVQNIQSNLGTVMADPTQVHQVLMNLCNNAAHAMKESGGTLTVKLEKTDEIDNGKEDIPPDDHLGYLKLTVADTGSGIAEDHLERIFDPYFTTKDVDEGSGLGLSVVHGIIKNHKGKINVISKPEMGTVFHIYFPQVDRKPSTLNPLKSISTNKSEHILLVDDEPHVVEAHKQNLTNLGYKVTGFIDSKQALEFFQAHPDDVDLIFTDMTMPSLTGDKLAIEAKKTRENIPVIICTGYSDKMNEEKAKSLGIDSFIMKPIFRDDLLKCISEVLNN